MTALVLAGVAATCAGVEYLLVLWNRAVVAPAAAPWRAAALSVTIRLASCYALVEVVADHRAIIAAALGDGAGTWLAVRRRWRP